MRAQPRVSVLALGGTIAMTKAAGEDAVRPALTAEALVAAVPTLPSLATVEARSFRSLPGASLGFADLVELAGAIEAERRAGSVGVVVTQGTDTLEETAYSLDLMLGNAAGIAVAFTGAMRNPSLPGADGPANLEAAVRFVVADGAAAAGVVVVMNDEVHEARFVRKAHTASASAFTSRVRGPVGWLAEGRVRLLAPTPRLGAVRPVGPVPAVALVAVGLGDDGRLLAQLAPLGFAGAVILALGGGHVPAPWAGMLERLARSMPVVLTSRVGDGEVLTATYGFEGSETDLARRGVLNGGVLDGPRARVLLSLLLASGLEGDALRAAFEARATLLC